MTTSANQLPINTFLTEKFLGKCWHEPKGGFGATTCTKCRQGTVHIPFKNNQNLFTPTGFFLLWEKAQKEEWWDVFVQTQHMNVRHRMNEEHLWLAPFINPLTFPTLLAEYLGWKEAR